MKFKPWKRTAGLSSSLIAPKKARARPRKLEEPIHIMCFNWIDSNIDGLCYHCPNGLDGGNEIIFIRGRPVAKAALAWKKLESMGAFSGVLDLTIHWRGDDGTGRTVYFEVKSKDGTVTDNQEKFMARLDACGIPHYLIRSLADCQAAVRHAGIPLKNFFPYTAAADSGNA